MTNLQNGVKILPKMSIAWVGRTNVTDRQTTDDRRQTTDRRQTDGRRHIANMNLSSRSLKMENGLPFFIFYFPFALENENNGMYTDPPASRRSHCRHSCATDRKSRWRILHLALTSRYIFSHCTDKRWFTHVTLRLRSNTRRAFKAIACGDV